MLQTWLELGLIGALLLAGIAVSFTRAIGDLAPPRAVVASALLVAATSILATGWGLWQPWLIACLGSAAALFLVADASNRRGSGGAA